MITALNSATSPSQLCTSTAALCNVAAVFRSMTSAESHNTLRPPPGGPQIDDSALDVEESASPLLSPAGGRRSSQATTQGRRPSGRVSFSSMLRHRPSFISRWKNGGVDEEAGVSSPRPDRAPIPSALQPPPEVYATPLPTLSMVVLSIVSLMLTYTGTI